MRAIEKFNPTTAITGSGVRASTFVQARVTIQVKATCRVALPSYPNRFILPKFYNTQIEQAVAGIGQYQNEANPIITYGLPNCTTTATPADAVDIPDETGRPIRSLPRSIVTRSATDRRRRREENAARAAVGRASTPARE